MGAKSYYVNLSHSGRKIARNRGESKGGTVCPLRRPSRPKQHWDFHQTERRLTSYRSGDIARARKKGGLKFLYSCSRQNEGPDSSKISVGLNEAVIMTLSFSLAAPLADIFLGANLLAVAVNAAEVKVFSSPAASGALTECVPQFERATGHKVLLDFANIAATRKRIAAGETFGIAFLSPKAIEELLQQGTIAAGTQYNLE